MNKQVLIVDHSAIMRSSLCQVLNRDYACTSCANEMEALEFLLRAQAVDAIVLDLSMPKMGGLALLQRIRSMTAFVQLPVLVLSAQTLSLNRITAIEAGASDFLAKPCNPLELKLRLSRLLPLERRSVRRSGFTPVAKTSRSSGYPGASVS